MGVGLHIIVPACIWGAVEQHSLTRNQTIAGWLVNIHEDIWGVWVGVGGGGCTRMHLGNSGTVFTDQELNSSWLVNMRKSGGGGCIQYLWGTVKQYSLMRNQTLAG